MKNKFLYPAILFVGLMLISFSFTPVYGQKPQTKSTKELTAKYTCTVHPEIVQEMSGNCPVCGKKLVEKKDMMKETMKQGPDTTKMRPAQKKMKVDSTMKKGHMKADTIMPERDLR